MKVILICEECGNQIELEKFNRFKLTKVSEQIEGKFKVGGIDITANISADIKDSFIEELAAALTPKDVAEILEYQITNNVVANPSLDELRFDCCCDRDSSLLTDF